MKKSRIILFILMFAFQGVWAQTIVATGVISNPYGMPVRYAFVHDKQLKTATYTDSLGRFSLTVNPASQLAITCKGYTAAAVAIDNHTSFNIVLKSDTATNGHSAVNADIKVVEEAFKPISDRLTGPAYDAFGRQTFNNVKETVGSRFFFNQWAHGYIVKMNGDIIQTPALLLNYDKMAGDLYLTEDQTSVLTGDKQTIKYFVLFGPHDDQHTFEMMTGISTDLYCEVLSAGNKYKLYKLIKTKFIPSNYKTDGVTSTGNTYDEYTDDNSYFVLNLTTTAFQELKLNKKSIKAVFADEGAKTDQFIASHKVKQDDAFVKSLGDAMNQ